MAADFNDILKELERGIADLAGSMATEYMKDANRDGSHLVQELKTDLKRWTLQLQNGELSPKDFEWLVNSQKGTLQMAALQHAGLAAIRIDQFKNGVLDLIVNTVFKAFKI